MKYNILLSFSSLDSLFYSNVRNNSMLSLKLSVRYTFECRCSVSCVADTTCSPPSDSSNEFPGDIFSQEQRLHGAFLVHTCVALYCFILIAFVCNDFFLPSVDCICQGIARLSNICYLRQLFQSTNLTLELKCSHA